VYINVQVECSMIPSITTNPCKTCLFRRTSRTFYRQY